MIVYVESNFILELAYAQEQLEGRTIEASLVLQKQRNLQPQDAIVYASVLSHMEHSSDSVKCFLNRNSKDFANPDIENNDLVAHSCVLITDFEEGLRYIQHKVAVD